MICVPRTDGTCAPRRGRRPRDIGAALVSWDRAARVADVLPADDPDRLAMRIAPRTLSCANGWRIHIPIAGKRFEELQDLCAAAGDKASVAIATMAGLLGERLIDGSAGRSLPAGERIHDAHRVDRRSRVDGRACHLTHGGRQNSRPARWPRCGDGRDRVIDLAEGDRSHRRLRSLRISLGVGIRDALHGPLVCWATAGWREDFNRARRDGPRCRSDVTGSGRHLHLRLMRSPCGVIAADDAALRDIDEALQSAERAADDRRPVGLRPVREGKCSAESRFRAPGTRIGPTWGRFVKWRSTAGSTP